MTRHILSSFIFIICSSMLIGQAGDQFTKNHPEVHKVVVEEVLQTTSYTYLFVKENDDHKWLALPKLNASPGDIYYHQSGFEMVDFKSAELDRTFESVWFLGGVISQDDFKNNTPGTHAQQPPGAAGAEVSREDTIIEQPDDGISIKELFTAPEKYVGKTVIIKGKVAKFNDGIMNRNWIHLHDGTDFEGKYDLVATTEESTEEGKIIVVEGKVSVNKDFGYGYFYELIIEDARIIP